MSEKKKQDQKVVTQTPEVEVRYIGHFVSEKYDFEEYNFLKECGSLVKVSRDYWKVSLEDDARLNVHMKRVCTYDIGLEFKETSKEFKDTFKNSNFMVFNDKVKKSKFTVVPRK